MSYKALYRTYRPMTFDEVAGQKHIVQTLKNALRENKIAHAYLFCGPRGTGKTTMARIFAKALNCETEFGNPCNHCENCVAITEGRHPDVIEIDAASNRGIDDIRDLVSKVKYSPILGRYKVYIIDEVHMMTNEAFNALLKTLEEPPENVVFILATTEPYKLMPTILSRCQRYDFTKVSDGDIYNRLFDILQNENIQIEEDALSMLVSLADGGVRDALSMLDQAIAYCGNNITLKAIQDLYGLSSKQEKIDLLMYANNKDFLKLSNAIKQLVENGVDIKRLTNELLEVLKDLLIYQTTKDASLLKKLTVTDCEYLALDNKKINAWIDILLNANSQYRLVNNITSLFEITMLKLSSYEEIKPVETIKIVEKVVETKPEPIKEEIKPTPVATPIEETKPNNEEVIPLTFSNVSFTSVNPFVDEGTPIIYTMDDVINIMVQATKECKNELNANWHLLDKLISHNRVGKYAATLKNTAPRIVCKTAVVFEASLKTITNKINLKENQYGFSKVVEALFGESCVVICMNHQEYVETVTKFSNLRQANKLPSPQEVNIDTKVEINQNYTKTKTAELAEELTRGEN
jgi:DNA polymerase III, subunit gamma and tau